MPTRPVGHAQLPTNQIHSNPAQPRKTFDLETQQALQTSLSQRGLINPISVVQLPEGGYLLIAGERRLRAAQALGWTSIEARIWPVSTPDNEVELLSVVENLQRQDLNPLEESQMYKALKEPPHSLSQRGIARLVGKPQSAIGLSLLLSDQPEAIQSLTVRTVISLGHIRYLNQITNIDDRVTWAERTGQEGWSVMQLAHEVRSYLRSSGKADPVIARPDVERADAGSPLETGTSGIDGQAAEIQRAGATATESGTFVPAVPPVKSESLSNFQAPEDTRANSLGSSLPEPVLQDAATEEVARSKAAVAADPLEKCWDWAREAAPPGASWHAKVAEGGGWSFTGKIPRADATQARAVLAQWLLTFGRRLLPDLTATVSAAPQAPQILEATYGNGHRLHLRWTASEDGFSYRIYRAPEDTDQFEKFSGADLSGTGAVVDCYGAGYKFFRLAVMAIDPQGRESELSRPVRFDPNSLNHEDRVDPA